jgi:hypothetical protein
MENADIILNVVIALLLVITIVFCLVLSKRISAFNSNKNDLAKFLLEFSSSIQRAEKNINLLKEMGSNVDENLKAQIKRARFLANDLSFLSEKGESVAQNLEGKISMTRDTQRKIATENSINSRNVSNQAREILSGDEPFRPRAAQQAQPASTNNNQMSTAKRQALDALLQEIARKKSETK